MLGHHGNARSGSEPLPKNDLAFGSDLHFCRDFVPLRPVGEFTLGYLNNDDAHATV